MIGRIERGGSAGAPVASIRRVADALGGRFDTTVRWQGGDVGRLLNARHSAMHEATAVHLGSLAAWTFEPEVSFSIYGERGVVDVLGWHADRRALLVIELKSELVDVNETMATLDRKHRLGRDLVRARGWEPAVVGVWLVLAEGRTNRRALASHATVLRAKFPTDGRTMRAWLQNPIGPVRALSFLPEASGVRLRPGVRPVRRVAKLPPSAGPS
jgi:hypothetical protein